MKSVMVRVPVQLNMEIEEGVVNMNLDKRGSK